MKLLIRTLLISCSICGVANYTIVNPTVAVANDIDKIIKAKDIVRSMVNYPDTLVFHDLYTKVTGNTVTLKFTCKNGFGVPETNTLDIKVN
jgi:hypothetical protein